jgi:hypothetical protein
MRMHDCPLGYWIKGHCRFACTLDTSYTKEKYPKCPLLLKSICTYRENEDG